MSGRGTIWDQLGTSNDLGKTEILKSPGQPTPPRPPPSQSDGNIEVQSSLASAQQVSEARLAAHHEVEAEE